MQVMPDFVDRAMFGFRQLRLFLTWERGGKGVFFKEEADFVTRG